LKDSVLTVSEKRKIQKLTFLSAEKVPSFEQIFYSLFLCTHNGGGGEVF
jgi:hypothetical protein